MKTNSKPIRKSIRLKHFNYSQNGAYFVTICVKDFKCLFGEVIDGKIILNEAGKIAETIWQEIPQKFCDIELDQFVVMPNHFHAILHIRRDRIYPVRRSFDADAINHVPTLSDIIRYFKGRAKFEIGKIEKNFVWQSRFYDHIIRDEESLDSIREYIVNNPLKWELDELYVRT